MGKSMWVPHSVSGLSAKRCKTHDWIFVEDKKFTDAWGEKGRWLRFHPNHKFGEYKFPVARRLGQIEEHESPSLLGIGLLSSAILAGGYLVFRFLQKRSSPPKPLLPMWDDELETYS